MESRLRGDDGLKIKRAPLIRHSGTFSPLRGEKGYAEAPLGERILQHDVGVAIRSGADDR